VPHFISLNGAAPGFICCIYATSPFVTAALLQEGLDTLKAHPDAFYAFPVSEYPNPIQRAFRIRRNGSLEMLWPENSTVRTQDLEPPSMMSASSTGGVRERGLAGAALHSTAAVPLVTSAHFAVDIDTEDDWLEALGDGVQHPGGCY
jgi:N-acylneuraminate cytidylyltransferase